MEFITYNDRPRRLGDVGNGAVGATAVSSLAVAKNYRVESCHRDEFSRSPHQSDYYGGIVATFIDFARHACVASKLSRRARMMDVRVDYLRWTVDPDLTANARVLRAGPSVGMVDLDVRDSADRAIATGRRVFGTREN